MSKGIVPAVGQCVELAPGEDLEQLRQFARRYEWLRRCSVHIQGDTTRYQGTYLDIRIDTGLEREYLVQGGEL